MMELLEKGKTFEWTPRREASFQELKKRLTTTSDIRSFLGLAGYYRRFIEGFSKIAKHMT
jgi:hypothetical protein